MTRTLVTTLVFILMYTPAHSESDQLTEGVWTGTLVYSDGTRRSADYHISVNEDNVTQMRLQDEEQIEFVFEPIWVRKGKVSFLWNPKNEDSQCTLKMSKDTNYYQGECDVLKDLSVTLTMHPPEKPREPEE